ncbi:Alpha-2-macroglobulin-P [Lamellibrachia satsuma]|nr:Alpha-2-macroglobulin-P [Lamellibrachia satsuma]
MQDKSPAAERVTDPSSSARFPGQRFTKVYSLRRQTLLGEVTKPSESPISETRSSARARLSPMHYGVETYRGMIVTAPKQMQAGATEKVFVTFHDIDFDVEMKLVLKEDHGPGEYGTWSFSFRAGQSQVIDFIIPDNVPVTVVVLHVEAASVDASRNYSFEAETKIAIQPSSLLTFLQTDKPMYKPGQTVLFRMLSVKSDLTPFVGEISEVWIQNPSGSRLAQWTDIKTNNGLASFEFAISDDPIQGMWKITGIVEGKRILRLFDVKEYVLPKFEVTVKPPSSRAS